MEGQRLEDNAADGAKGGQREVRGERQRPTRLGRGPGESMM